MDVTSVLPDDFRYILFEKVDPTRNVSRFYYLTWQATLLDAGAILRLYGRKGGGQRMLSPLPFASAAEACPTLEALVKRRLKRGYRVVAVG